MTQYETSASVETTVAANWWTPLRIKWVGFVALLWNFAFATLVFTYNGLALDPTPGAYPGFQAWLLWAPHIVAYLSISAVLLAVENRYEFGRLARVIVSGYAGLFAVLAVGTTINTALPMAPALEPIYTVSDITWIAVHFLATGVGIVLWRAVGVSRLGAALFVSVLPMIGVVLALDLTAGAMEIPLVLGAAALGYQLWESPSTTATVPTDASTQSA